jgi:hypothetical protein
MGSWSGGILTRCDSVNHHAPVGRIMYMKWPLKESPFRRVPCQAPDVEAVMVDGRWPMHDGALLTIDEASIVQEADRIGRVAWQRLFAKQPALTPLPGWHPLACER